VSSEFASLLDVRGAVTNTAASWHQTSQFGFVEVAEHGDAGDGPEIGYELGLHTP
jgi:hypothetical protein